eukprot:TRINITY_DN7906_c0_g1_i1.p1 TRINITY_DN7906_c0_g1~~TRINITY_DN7906_c0_g1_i1.p1  ORF type:complete len:476 (+),score=104.86 TRINITY_DN7906_c0_g1_i1:74-1501(+)
MAELLKSKIEEMMNDVEQAVIQLGGPIEIAEFKKIRLMSANRRLSAVEHFRSVVEDLKNTNGCLPFCRSVDPLKDGVSNYWDVVARPLDISKVLTRFHEYQSIPEVYADVNQVFLNAKLYWPAESQISSTARSLESTFDRMVEEFLSTRRQYDPVIKQSGMTVSTLKTMCEGHQKVALDRERRAGLIPMSDLISKELTSKLETLVVHQSILNEIVAIVEKDENTSDKDLDEFDPSILTAASQWQLWFNCDMWMEEAARLEQQRQDEETGIVAAPDIHTQENPQPEVDEDDGGWGVALGGGSPIQNQPPAIMQPPAAPSEITNNEFTNFKASILRAEAEKREATEELGIQHARKKLENENQIQESINNERKKIEREFREANINTEYVINGILNESLAGERIDNLDVHIKQRSMFQSSSLTIPSPAYNNALSCPSPAYADQLLSSPNKPKKILLSPALVAQDPPNLAPTSPRILSQQ